MVDGKVSTPKVLREINRSFDCAKDFEYPIIPFYLTDGREVIAHCPDNCRGHLVIEDLVSGKQIAASTGELFRTMDYYYSRLAVNPSGKRLLSTGWAWQPYNCMMSRRY